MNLVDLLGEDPVRPLPRQGAPPPPPRRQNQLPEARKEARDLPKKPFVPGPGGAQVPPLDPAGVADGPAPVDVVIPPQEQWPRAPANINPQAPNGVFPGNKVYWAEAIAYQRYRLDVDCFCEELEKSKEPLQRFDELILVGFGTGWDHDPPQNVNDAMDDAQRAADQNLLNAMVPAPARCYKKVDAVIQQNIRTWIAPRPAPLPPVIRPII